MEWTQRDAQSDRPKAAPQGRLYSVQFRETEEKSLDQCPQYSSRCGLEEPQSPWEASAEHSSNQPATYQWSKTEESSGCGVQLRLKEELGVAFTTSTCDGRGVVGVWKTKHSPKGVRASQAGPDLILL